MVTFCEFPTERCHHLRAPNPMELPFAGAEASGGCGKAPQEGGPSDSGDPEDADRG